MANEILEGMSIVKKCGLKWVWFIVIQVFSRWLIGWSGHCDGFLFCHERTDVQNRFQISSREASGSLHQVNRMIRALEWSNAIWVLLVDDQHVWNESESAGDNVRKELALAFAVLPEVHPHPSPLSSLLLVQELKFDKLSYFGLLQRFTEILKRLEYFRLQVKAREVALQKFIEIFHGERGNLQEIWHHLDSFKSLSWDGEGGCWRVGGLLCKGLLHLVFQG